MAPTLMGCTISLQHESAQSPHYNRGINQMLLEYRGSPWFWLGWSGRTCRERDYLSWAWRIPIWKTKRWRAAQGKRWAQAKLQRNKRAGHIWGSMTLDAGCVVPILWAEVGRGQTMPWMPRGRHTIDNGEALSVSEQATKLDDSACGYRRGEANGV